MARLKASAIARGKRKPPPNPLAGVPRFQQRDSAQLSQHDRTCFASSCAMLLQALKPGTLQCTNGDEKYPRWCSARATPPTPPPSSRRSPTSASPPG